MYKSVFAAMLVMVASSVSGQARIVDSQPITPARDSQSMEGGGAAPMSIESELFFQVQALQEEVLELRGLVEEQSYELRRLKQQRLDDYVDLDRRISQITGAPSTAPPIRTSTDNSATVAGDAEIVQSTPAEELTAYRDAIDLVLKQKKFDAGIEALQQYLKVYPRGNYSANAQYWLGQIYLQKQDFPNSKIWFSRMISEFPSHQKVDEAKFKLGKVHDMLGEKKQAEKLLREVANSANSAVARMAEDYLKSSM